MPEIPGVDEMVAATMITQMRNIQCLACLGTSRRSTQKATLPQAQSMGPIIFLEPNETHGDDISINIYMDIGEHREDLDSITLGEG